MIAGAIGSVGDELRRLHGGGRGRILLAIGLGWGITIAGRTIYPALLPQLRTAYGLDLTVAGLLLSVLFAAYALGQLPGGILADRVGERIVLSLSVSVSATALLFVIFSRSTLALFVATAVFGFAVGFYAIARFTAIARIYPEGYGTAIGLSNAAPEVGQAVVPPIAGLIAVAAGWQLGFGFVIPVFVVVAVALWLTVPSTPPDRTSAVDSLTPETARYVLAAIRHPPVVLGTVAMILGISVWQAFTGFYPTYLVESKGLSSPIASGLFGLYFAATALVHPISGAIYDRWNVRYTFVLVGVSSIAMATLPFAASVWQLVIISILLGGLLGFETSTESYLVAALPDDIEGTGFGILRTTVFATGAVSPLLFGAVADRGYFDELFVVLAACTALVVAIAFVLPTRDR